jgi:hypothetical protein
VDLRRRRLWLGLHRRRSPAAPQLHLARRIDIREKFQLPGEQYVATGRTYEKDGYVPGWRCIRDKDGRIVVAICFNMHLGDAWEWADAGDYPEKFSGLAFRIVINYITYAMTH